MRRRTGFTEHELETAIRVMMKSKIVRNWVEGQARAFGVDLNTPEGKEFHKKESRAAAERLIK